MGPCVSCFSVSGADEDGAAMVEYALLVALTLSWPSSALRGDRHEHQRSVRQDQLQDQHPERSL